MNRVTETFLLRKMLDINKCALKNKNNFLSFWMWYVFHVARFNAHTANCFFFSFQQINVGSRCSGNYIFFNSRALVSFQSLSEVSALVFMFRLTFESHEWAANCESLLSECGAEAPAKSALMFDLSFPGSLTPRPQEWERDPQNKVERFAAYMCVPQTWACRKENSLFHSNFFLRDHFLYPNDIANGFCFKSSILKDFSVAKIKVAEHSFCARPC